MTLATRIQELATTFVKASDPGFALLVMRDGEILCQQEYGLAERGKQRLIEPTTRFNIASLTKLFTALAILQLEKQGALERSDSVVKHLGQLHNARWQGVTIENLLRHESGLPEYCGDDDLEQICALYATTIQELNNGRIVAWAAEQDGQFTPGTKYEYCNTNYVLLASLIEERSGCSFAEYLQTRIFTPIGMNGAVLYDSSSKEIENRAHGYTFSDKGFQISSSPLSTYGDGGMYLTLGDMLAFERDLIAGKQITHQMLELAYARGQHPVGSDHFGKPDDSRRHTYGLGWVISESDQGRIAHHGGGWHDSHTYYSRYTDLGLSVASFSARPDLKMNQIHKAVITLALEALR